MATDFEPISLANKTILISGGTTGIGRSTAVRLAQDDARMLIFGRHERELNDALADIQKVGKGEVHGMIADQSKHDDVIRVFEEVDRRFDGLDILINNAAIAGENLLDSEYEDWKYLFDSNVLGYMDCARQAIERMEKRGEGHIVNVGSLSAKELKGDSLVYSVSKAANRAFSETLRKLVNKDKKIKVSLIEPGLVGTDLMGDDRDAEEQRKKAAKGEMLTAEDIAESIHYTLTQPWRCDIISVQIRPRFQII